MTFMRKADDNSTSQRFRAGTRFFCMNAEWFYTLREGDEGPFDSKEEAERHLDTFLSMQDIKEFQHQKVEKIRPDKITADPMGWNSHPDVL